MSKRRNLHACPLRALSAHHDEVVDNDVYGHVNNVVYYSTVDSPVNGLLINAGLLDITKGPRLPSL